MREVEKMRENVNERNTERKKNKACMNERTREKDREREI